MIGTAAGSGDHDIGPPRVDGDAFRESLTELDMGEVEVFGGGSGLGEHLVSHVDADDGASRTGLAGGNERIEASPRADIDDTLALVETSQRERIADAGE